MNRRVFINLIAFVGVFLLMIWWAVNNIISFDFIDRPYQIKGEFAAAAGVAENSEVAYLGLNYGSVRSVESVDGKVLITMDIQRGKEIPAGSIARIFRKSAVGEPYIDFNPPESYSGDENAPMIQEGEVVPLDRTEVPLEFSELLRAASRVLGAVDPEQTRILIHELAVALNGRSDALRSLTVNSDALLQTFVDRSDLIDRLSANNTRLTRTVTAKRGSLSEGIRNLTEVAATLRSIEPDTQVLLDRGNELIGTAADLVADVKQDLDCVLKDLDEVITLTSTEQNLDGLRFNLEEAPTALNYVFLTRDTEPEGVWVRVNLLTEFENPAQEYVPHTELPAVPAVPACVSALSSGGIRFSGETLTPSTGSLPATGGEPMHALLLFLGTGAVLALVARRSVRS